MTLSSGGISQQTRDQASLRAVSVNVGFCQSLTISGSHNVVTLKSETSICLVRVGASRSLNEQQLPVFGFLNCEHVGQSEDDPTCGVRDSACDANWRPQQGFTEASSADESPGLRKQHSQKSCPFAAAHLHCIRGTPAPRMNGIIPTTNTFQRIWRTEFIALTVAKSELFDQFVEHFDAEVGYRFQPKFDFVNIGLTCLGSSTTNCCGRESTKAGRLELLNLLSVLPNRFPTRQCFSKCWMLRCRALVLRPRADCGSVAEPRIGWNARNSRVIRPVAQFRAVSSATWHRHCSPALSPPLPVRLESTEHDDRPISNRFLRFDRSGCSHRISLALNRLPSRGVDLPLQRLRLLLRPHVKRERLASGRVAVVSDSSRRPTRHRRTTGPGLRTNSPIAARTLARRDQQVRMVPQV